MASRPGPGPLEIPAPTAAPYVEPPALVAARAEQAKFATVTGGKSSSLPEIAGQGLKNLFQKASGLFEAVFDLGNNNPSHLPTRPQALRGRRSGHEGGIAREPAGEFVRVPLALIEQKPGEIDEGTMRWERNTSDPIRLLWESGQLPVGDEALPELNQAFAYAKSQVLTRLTGTVFVSLVHSPMGDQGPSLGAALAVGFLAVLKGDSIRPGIALTGTLQPDGRIGAVANLEETLLAAAGQGHHTLLVPKDRLGGARPRLVNTTAQPNIQERRRLLELPETIAVETIAEAYEIMTGKPLGTAI